MADFLEKAVHVVTWWSKDHDVSRINSTSYQTREMIKLSTSQQAIGYNFLMENRNIYKKQSNGFTHFFFKSSDGLKQTGVCTFILIFILLTYFLIYISIHIVKQLRPLELDLYVKKGSILDYKIFNVFVKIHFGITKTSIPTDLNKQSYFKT